MFDDTTFARKSGSIDSFTDEVRNERINFGTGVTPGLGGVSLYGPIGTGSGHKEGLIRGVSPVA